MKLRFVHGLAGLFMILSTCQFVAADTPLGGLTVAVHPSGSQLVCAGDNRTLYVIDAETLEVRNRVWLNDAILRLGFSADGSRLWANGTGDTLIMLDTSNWSILKEFRGLRRMVVAGDRVAAIESNKKQVRVFAAGDASEIGNFPFPEKKTVECVGIDPTGKLLAALTRGVTDEDEQKVAYSDIPKDLTGLEKYTFVQKNDGKTSHFSVIEMDSQKTIQENTLYYSPGHNANFVFNSKGVAVIAYDNVNANIDAQGDVKLFNLESGYNYGAGVYGNEIATGGLRRIAITTPEDGSSRLAELDKLPGWPEYLKGFARGPKGKWYATTSGYRLARIADGKIEKTVPVF